ncbi:MAG: hypothetical protein IT426_15420 [Pirellulales bacterium]|nr:hypothetical protein [Pirellulales bacterium]
MSVPPEKTPSAARANLYSILICASVGLMLGRVLAVESVDKIGLEKDRIAHLDRDIAAAKASLLKKGLQGEALEKSSKAKEETIRRDANLRRPFLSANDRSRWCTVRALVEPEMRVPGEPYAIEKVIQEPNWDTIDMVQHNGHLYSSKPPLLATLLAGIYWVIFHLTGMSLGTHPFVVGRIMLILVNVLPLAIGFCLLAKLAERFGATDWGRTFVVAAAAFGTFLTTFAVTLNNHVIAAVACIVFIYFAVPIWFDGERRMRSFFAGGLAGAFMAANELPALALFAGVGLALLWKAPRQTLAAYLPAALLVAVPFFATNQIAFGTLEIPYMHRTAKDNWYHYEYMRNGRTIKSYWNNPAGVDRGEKSVAVYAANVLVGHHGIFSLTPIWLMSVFGTFYWLLKGPERKLRELALLVGAVSAVCIGYFIFQPLENRNYGGVASGFRWAFWMAPLWLLVMLPAADVFLRNKWLKALTLAMLIVSSLSAAYPTWNPWSNPWIIDFVQYLRS